MLGTQETFVSLGALLSEGGVTMIPIYLCSFIALTIFLRKFFEFRALGVDPAWVERLLDAMRRGDFETASQWCNGKSQPATRVAEGMAKTFVNRPDRVEAEARRIGTLELRRLEKGLSVMAFIAQAAPLLGLLGTVLGMVDLFLGLQGSSQGQIDVGALSSGIWKALLTTAAGLTVAVPSLAGHAYLASRTDRVRMDLGDLVQRVLSSVPPSKPPESLHGV